VRERTRSWQFFGGPGSRAYAAFDAVRRLLNRRLVDYLGAVAIPHRDSRVLEAGSGPGYASWLFAQRDNVRLSVSADIDIDSLHADRQLNRRRSGVVADLYRLPFRSQSFDLVWNSSTLEHLASPDVALAEMARVVRDEGHVFVGLPYRFGPLGFQPLIQNTPLGVWIGPVFSRTRLIQMLRDQGLVAVSTRTYFFRFFLGVVGRKRAASGAAERK
jgi:SAM-dependent methyltransferase